MIGNRRTCTDICKQITSATYYSSLEQNVFIWGYFGMLDSLLVKYVASEIDQFAIRDPIINNSHAEDEYQRK